MYIHKPETPSELEELKHELRRYDDRGLYHWNALHKVLDYIVQRFDQYPPASPATRALSGVADEVMSMSVAQSHRHAINKILQAATADEVGDCLVMEANREIEAIVALDKMETLPPAPTGEVETLPPVQEKKTGKRSIWLLVPPGQTSAMRRNAGSN